MTLKTTCLGQLAALAALSLGLAGAARADIVYDNTTTASTNVFLPLAAEYGDEIQLQPGLGRLVTRFLFEYYGDFVKQGDEKVRVRFYENNGDVEKVFKRFKTPGKLLYDSGLQPLEPGFRSLDLPGLDVTVPDTFTWSVQFSGLAGGAGDRAGLLLYNPPTVGKSFNDFWLFIDGEWSINQIEGGSKVANFGARVVAIVPEPSVLALGGLGTLLLVGARCRRRRPTP
jgi:hypothetical protein